MRIAGMTSNGEDHSKFEGGTASTGSCMRPNFPLPDISAVILSPTLYAFAATLILTPESDCERTAAGTRSGLTHQKSLKYSASRLSRKALS